MEEEERVVLLSLYPTSSSEYEVITNIVAGVYYPSACSARGVRGGVDSGETLHQHYGLT